MNRNEFDRLVLAIAQGRISAASLVRGERPTDVQLGRR